MNALIAHINALPIAAHVTLTLASAILGGAAFGFIIGRIWNGCHERIADASRVASQITDRRLLNEESV